jgi:hypothetical protein
MKTAKALGLTTPQTAAAGGPIDCMLTHQSGAKAGEQDLLC